MKLTGRMCFDIFWVVFFAGISISGLSLEFEAALIPLLVSGLCLIFSLVNLVKALIPKEGRERGMDGKGIAADSLRAEESTTIPVSHRKKKTEVDPKVAWKRFFNISLWLIGFMVGTYLFGHYVAIPLFTFLFLRSRKESWVLSISCAVIVTAGVYLAIVLGTRTPLYEGLLFSLLGME